MCSSVGTKGLEGVQYSNRQDRKPRKKQPQPRTLRGSANRQPRLYIATRGPPRPWTQRPTDIPSVYVHMRTAANCARYRRRKRGRCPDTPLARSPRQNLRDCMMLGTRGAREAMQGREEGEGEEGERERERERESTEVDAPCGRDLRWMAAMRRVRRCMLMLRHEMKGGPRRRVYARARCSRARSLPQVMPIARLRQCR